MSDTRGERWGETCAYIAAAPQRGGDVEKRSPILFRQILRSTLKQLSPVLKVVIQLIRTLTGLNLSGNRMTPRSHRIRPRIYTKCPITRDIRNEKCIRLILIIRSGAHMNLNRLSRH
ncbi:Hypothetical protein [Corynebacterium glutamicum ATCC 13032]|uniref:Uncharacterized protein n=1 Tax=Corynebacterium glutamicum (strain ATCC 13032 / DSM 20300 / JCM 1318 / BCRC 11384 / CCUG 27702 / LMG 3730 / NBRC 12168 / NCIMB 10025 / NRRL B-2784 / 534) TaxID=196627 RepID=Q8NR38_CORGL|nr:Hypothetical protein [Corynebacterium glutamicum ATCC 13032]